MRRKKKERKEKKKMKEAERGKCERQRGSTDTFHSATNHHQPFLPYFLFQGGYVARNLTQHSLSTVLRKIP